MKLNQSGFGHVFSIMAAVVVIAAVGYTGYRIVGSSSANVAKKECGSGFKSVKSEFIKKNGKGAKIGKLSVFSNGKRYCAILQKKGAAEGVATQMYVELGATGSGCKKQSNSGVAQGGSGAAPVKGVADSGNFQYYAGPVYKNTNCAFAVGYMDFDGKQYYANIVAK